LALFQKIRFVLTLFSSGNFVILFFVVLNTKKGLECEKNQFTPKKKMHKTPILFILNDPKTLKVESIITNAANELIKKTTKSSHCHCR